MEVVKMIKNKNMPQEPFDIQQTITMIHSLNMYQHVNIEELTPFRAEITDLNYQNKMLTNLAPFSVGDHVYYASDKDDIDKSDFIVVDSDYDNCQVIVQPITYNEGRTNLVDSKDKKAVSVNDLTRQIKSGYSNIDVFTFTNTNDIKWSEAHINELVNLDLLVYRSEDTKQLLLGYFDDPFGKGALIEYLGPLFRKIHEYD